jgi:hypothetical protein
MRLVVWLQRVLHPSLPKDSLITMRPLTKNQNCKFQNIILCRTTYKNWETRIKLPSKNCMIDDNIFQKGRNGVSLLSYLRTQGGLETTRNQLNFVLIQPK